MRNELNKLKQKARMIHGEREEKKESKWREEHDQIQKTIQLARKMKELQQKGDKESKAMIQELSAMVP